MNAGTSVTLTTDTAGTVTQSGPIAAGTLTLSGNSTFALNTEDNKVGTIAASTVIAGLTFTNTGTAMLTVNGIDAGTGNIVIGNRGAAPGSAGNITVNGPLAAAGPGTVTLRAGINNSLLFNTPGTVTVAGTISAPVLRIEGEYANRSSGTVTAAVEVYADHYPDTLFGAVTGTKTFISRSNANLELNNTGTATAAITDTPLVPINASTLSGSPAPVLRTAGNIYVTGAVIAGGQSLTLENSGSGFIEISGSGLTMSGASVLVLNPGPGGLRLNGGAINIPGDFSVTAPVFVGDGGNSYHPIPDSAGAIKAASITIYGTVNGTDVSSGAGTNNLTLEAAGAIYITGIVGGITRLGNITVNNGIVDFDAAVNAKSYTQAADSANFDGPQNYTGDFAFTGTNLTVNSTLNAGGSISIPGAANVSFSAAAAVTAAGFTQSSGTGTTVFNGSQNYTGDFAFAGTNLRVNSTLQTDSDNTNDGAFSFTGTDFTLNGPLATGNGSANTVTINNAGVFSTTAAGTISAGGVFRQNGTAGTVSIGAGITATNTYPAYASITFTDEVQLTGAVAMNSSAGNGDINLPANVTSSTDQSLTLNAGGGVVNAGGSLGTSASRLGEIVLSGGVIIISGIHSSAKTSVTNTGLFESNAALISDDGFEQLPGSTGSGNLKADITTSGTLIRFIQPVSIDSSITPLNLDTGTGAGDISLAAVSGPGKNLTLSAGTGNITLAGEAGTSADRLGILKITSAKDAAFEGNVWAASFDQSDTAGTGSGGSGLTTFTGTQDYTGGFKFFGTNLTVNNTLNAGGAISIPGAVDVSFSAAAAVTAVSFTQDAGSGTTVFDGTQDYTAGFSFTGTNLRVNNTLKTDADTSGGDGAITVTLSGAVTPLFTVGPAGDILPGGSGTGGMITVNGNTNNSGKITAVPTDIPIPIDFNGSYISAAAGSLIGSAGTTAQTIIFRGDAVFGNFTHHGDTVQFSTSTNSVTAHQVSQAAATFPVFADALIDAGNTVTAVSGTTLTQDAARILTLSGTAALILEAGGSWLIGPPSLPAPWYMLSSPSSSPTGDPGYINPGPAFTTGFAGFNGTLDLGNGASLSAGDFYTQITGAGHAFTLKAPSGSGEMCTIKASGNVVINETFEDPGHSTFIMDGGSALAVRSAPGNPRIVNVDLWNFTADAAGAVINSDVNFRGTVTINPGANLSGGSLPASSPHIHVLPTDGLQAEWIQNGIFTPCNSIVEFGDETYAAWTAPRTYTIRGNTAWYNFVCREKGAVIKFSEHPDKHTVQHGFTVNPVLAGENPTLPPWSTNKDNISIKLDRIAPSADLAPVPPLSPTSDFWVFELDYGAVMSINFVRIKYSYSTRRLPVPPAFDLNWYVKAWPYYDDPLDPVNTPYESFWDVNWFVFNNFFYSYTEDADHNGKIDRIRAQSAFEANGDFSNFNVSVDGYEIDRNKGSNGFSLAGASLDKLDSIYIYLKEKDYTDGGAVLNWRITQNGSLKDIIGGANVIGNVGEEMTTIDTVPPRLNYALTIPGSDKKQVYFQMSEPVNHTSPSAEGAAPIRVANVDHVASAAFFPNSLNSRSFSDRYGFVGSGALEYTFPLDTVYTVSELVNGGKTFDLEDVYDMAVPARDLHADRFIERTDFIDPRFYYQYPSPKYPVDWEYGEYVYVSYKSAASNYYPDKNGTRPERSTYDTSNSNVLIPPHRLVDFSSSTPPPYTDHTITHRVTDVLISVPPKDKGDARYFVWPIWARYTDPANPSAVGNDDLWGQQINDTGIIWDFTGAKTLEDRATTMQVRVNGILKPSVPALQYAAKIPESYHARQVDSGGYGHGNAGLVLPLPAGTTEFINLVPEYYHQFTNTNHSSQAGSLFVFNLQETASGYESGGSLEFLLRLNNSPPDLFAARLNIPLGAEIPEDWYQRVRPFSYGIRNVTLQRGGATILNNVINPNNGERTYIRYHLMKSGRVTVQVFTLDGTLVKILRRESRSAGEWVDSWDGTNNGGRVVARGMYFIRVVGPDIDEIRKVMVVK